MIWTVDDHHYLITVCEVLETIYEVWADDESQAIAIATQDSRVDDPRRFQTDERVHPPAPASMSLVLRRHQC